MKKLMNIYFVYRPDGAYVGYDEYDSFVAVAPDEATVRTMHPSSDKRSHEWGSHEDTWVHKDSIDSLVVQHVGIAVSGSNMVHVIDASFNAG